MLVMRVKVASSDVVEARYCEEGNEKGLDRQRGAKQRAAKKA